MYLSVNDLRSSLVFFLFFFSVTLCFPFIHINLAEKELRYVCVIVLLVIFLFC